MVGVTSYTPETFAVAVLHGLGAPVTNANVRALVGWQRAEGGHWHNTARYNPLNTTLPMPGAGNTGTQGNIKVYRSWQQGINATVKTLRNGYYGGIIRALHHGNNPGAVAQAIGSSPWGTSAQLVQSVINGTHVGHIPAVPHTGQNTASPGTTPSPLEQGGTGLASLLAQLQDAPARPQGSLLQAPAYSTDQRQGAGIRAPQMTAPPQQQQSSSLSDLLASMDQQGPSLPSSPKQATIVAGAGGGGTVHITGVKGVKDFGGKQVAGWIAPVLQWARSHGWQGSVSSGFRSYADQQRIYNSGVRPAARPGTSNHEGANYPRGAVDVTDAAQLARVLRNSPYAHLLVWAGGKDPVHFSHPHNGGY